MAVRPDLRRRSDHRQRAYTDWSKATAKRDDMLRLGIEPIHLFQSPSGKNAADIRLSIDAIELMFQSPVDTFVVVSADSDFVPLISRLRSAGKTVFGAGRRAAVSATLIQSCDRFFYLEEARKTAKSTPVAAKPLLVRAVQAAQDEEGNVPGSKLHATLRRLDPSFSFRDQGFSTFSKYLAAQADVDIVRPHGSGDVTVTLNEGKPGKTAKTARNEWEQDIDRVWSARASKTGDFISGRTAASDAAKALGVKKLADSSHQTLQKLLGGSPLLTGRWRRDGNRIIKI